ncbi:MAG: PadR family transcriptional regulator [Phycisphaerales bacterium]|nr:PadR family transcriptional regulator [Phycisphaerales bacterium]
MTFNSNLLRGSIDLVALAALADGEKYGYLILKRLREASHDRHKVQAGTLYPILHRLEYAGAITSRWEDVGERRRKWYRLTRAGRAKLKNQAQQWYAFSDYINALLSPVLPST